MAKKKAKKKKSKGVSMRGTGALNRKLSGIGKP